MLAGSGWPCLSIANAKDQRRTLILFVFLASVLVGAAPHAGKRGMIVGKSARPPLAFLNIGPAPRGPTAAEISSNFFTDRADAFDGASLHPNAGPHPCGPTLAVKKYFGRCAGGELATGVTGRINVTLTPIFQRPSATAHGDS